MHKTTKLKRVEILCIRNIHTMRDFTCSKYFSRQWAMSIWAFGRSDIDIHAAHIHHTLIIDDNRYENTLNKFFTVKTGAKTFSNQPRKKKEENYCIHDMFYALDASHIEHTTNGREAGSWFSRLYSRRTKHWTIIILNYFFHQPLKIQNLILIKHDWYFAFWQINSCFFPFRHY